MKNLLLVAMTTVAMSSAQALEIEPEFYGGASYSTWQFSQSNPDMSSTLSIYSLEGIAGLKLHPNISFELRGGAGLNSDKERDIGGVNIEVAMEYYGSAYFRPVLENDKASLYGLLGYTAAVFDADPSDEQTTEDAQYGASYGFGASFKYDEKADFFIEWKKLINADSISMRGASIGFTYKF